ncbi:lysophospholipid acyltransferase family protein [Gilvimarinus agarilyticus]|uniref:lysophospholipid acyltransferase family protein n=1 Tax=Gilvimarinus agarilyticus TaxID=679259 RepID=UPI00059F1EE7|nr:lysophospholipid acyltransferase family protein [Gilvimarinus agarilyticus]
MLNIEQSVTDKFPRFANTRPVIRGTTLSLLRKITHEQEINQFLHNHNGLRGIDFIDQIFDYFNFNYSVSSRDRNNIPSQGRVVIVANHPIGSLDGLALLRMVSEVRKDVRIVANDMLMAFKPLHNVFLPLDNMTRSAYRKSYKAILEALNNEEAVIIFPAGEVSRASPKGIRDGAWHAGFLHFARKTSAPVLPIFIEAKNSLLFYSASMLYKPLGTALLAREMFKKHSGEIRFRVGEAIPHTELRNDKLADKALIQRLKKHLYKLRKKNKPQFITERTIAHPEDRAALKAELASATEIGKTSDNNQIFLCDHHTHPTVLREIGRLRELTFRLVGEGTGSRRDLDKYDQHYRHLVLWDDNRLCIAGAYRIADCARILREHGSTGLYTDELFHYQPTLYPYLQQAVELGRSFVHPDYWGKASLEYLWQGLGAYLQHDTSVRYVLGPVSMSATYPKALRDLCVYFYQHYYQCQPPLAGARHPHLLDDDKHQELQHLFADMDVEDGFRYLQKQFSAAGHKIPTLYKQYAALYEPGGYQLLAFSVDSDFGDCLDGLFMGDLTKMKANKRKRYLGDTQAA